MNLEPTMLKRREFRPPFVSIAIAAGAVVVLALSGSGQRKEVKSPPPHKYAQCDTLNVANLPGHVVKLSSVSHVDDGARYDGVTYTFQGRSVENTNPIELTAAQSRNDQLYKDLPLSPEDQTDKVVAVTDYSPPKAAGYTRGTYGSDATCEVTIQLH
jgi:hypothetical protein